MIGNKIHNHHTIPRNPKTILDLLRPVENKNTLHRATDNWRRS